MHINGNILDFSGAFFSGVLVSMTPCVFPLMPVTAAAIAGANVSGTRKAGFFLSLLYVMGLAFTYAGLAVFAAISGKLFGALQNTPLFLGAIAGAFLFFSLAMFDIIPLPALKLFSAAKPKSPLAVFIMGVASGFVVGPCTAPALGAFLVYVASKRNIIYGASLLFVFAYGVGSSLILAGTFGGVLASWPRSGVWMLWVKRFAGLVLLVFSGYYFLRVFHII